MKWSNVPVCYYPTTTLLVDDKTSFLNDLQLGLDIITTCKTYSNPQNLLDFIEDQYMPDPFTDRCLNYDEDSHIDHITTHTDIRAIQQEIHIPHRFDQISVLVIDYAMPGINGIECCEKIIDKHIYKILLTGEADNDIAVEAFNRGIIDKFIQKNNPNLKVAINQAVDELQRKYFYELSKKIFTTLPSALTQKLNDPIFAEFFQQLCEKEQIIEFYLTD